MSRLLTTTAALALTLAAAPALAQAQTQARTATPVAMARVAAADPAVLEPITVVGSRQQARDLGGAATFLDDETLRTFDYTDVHRVLRLVPGVVTQEEEGFGLRPNIGIRGSGTDRSARVAIMEDGVLIAPAPYAAPAAYYFPRISRMTGVEVVKGPGAIKYGPLTVGGAINFTSTPIGGAGGDDLSGYLSLSGGSYGGFRGHGVLGGWSDLGDSGWQFGAQAEWLREQSDGFKELDNGGPTGFEIDDRVFKLGLRTAPGAARAQSLTFKYQELDERSDETYLGLTLDDFNATPYRRYAGSQADVMNVDHRTLQL
ncbi:TonB-dependent receptor plug domain-containing protein, partial [Brevundimonas sp.]|uniref:TonB-dependent receptor plug domain-containing protein n=1 Tax=Brevundimonas sp. TaxID=1871086 RepID=UPI0035126B46